MFGVGRGQVAHRPALPASGQKPHTLEGPCCFYFPHPTPIPPPPLAKGEITQGEVLGPGFLAGVSLGKVTASLNPGP